MEFNSYGFPVLLTILLSLGSLFILYNRFSPELISRFSISNAIDLFLYDKHYELIENISLCGNNGESIQLKQLIISRYGLFIIQTCHYRNKIFGSNHQVKWMSEGRINSTIFINPSITHQHLCEVLANYLNIPASTCHVINVFTGNSKLPLPAPKNSCKQNSLIKTISTHRYISISPKNLHNIKTILTNAK